MRLLKLNFICPTLGVHFKIGQFFLLLVELREEENNHSVQFQTAGQHGEHVPALERGGQEAVVAGRAKQAVGRADVSHHA